MKYKDLTKSAQGLTLEEGAGGLEGKCPEITDFRDFAPGPKSLLLHSCCGPCSTAVIEALVGEFQISIFYYNPNITDEEEYEKRKATQVQFIEAFNSNNLGKARVNFISGDYDVASFYKEAKGLENEAEGGKRCAKCFKLRLDKTAQIARLYGYDFFATTLSVSPHKDYIRISATGRDLSLIYGLNFLDRDFKKKAGYQRSIELSKEYGLYRQSYCGCEYSKRR